MTAARGFARYLSGIDPATEVPPRGWWPAASGGGRRSSTPQKTSRCCSPRPRRCRRPLRSATYSTLFGLLAATGMRVGEALTSTEPISTGIRRSC